MGVLNTDLAKQLEAQTLGARLWRLAAGQASTRHRHAEQAELYLLLEGAGRMRVGDETSRSSRSLPCSSRLTPCVSCSTTPTPTRCGWSWAHRPKRPTPFR